jgi:hypothetical protein
LFVFLVFCVVVFGGGSVVLIFLVFCVVVFGGARGAHLFSFLCCGKDEHHGPQQTLQHRKLKR